MGIYEDDRIRRAIEHRRAIDELDAEVRDERSEEYRQEQAAWLAARAKWEALPPVRLRRGVPSARLTEAEESLLDREGL